jgi:hypothetical protein
MIDPDRHVLIPNIVNAFAAQEALRPKARAWRRKARRCRWRSRCQARGGPRARTRTGFDDASSDVTLKVRRAAVTGRGSGSEIAGGGTPAPAMWITAQVAQ